jgi:hypothetical protein
MVGTMDLPRRLTNPSGSSFRTFSKAAPSRRRRVAPVLSWVTENFGGSRQGIKEFVVGIEVRPSRRFPKVDTIVRVEAGKLRKRLDQYYENDGASTPVRITMARAVTFREL